MKQIKNPKVGQLVQVPVYEFAPLRSGWNGWIFRVGMVDSIYISKTGKKCAKVRFCSATAGRYQLLPCKEHISNFLISNVFEWGGLEQVQRNYSKFKQYEINGDQVCWDQDTAFLVQNGFIK